MNELIILDGLHKYINRCKNYKILNFSYVKQSSAIESIFERSTKTLFDGLQRIMFLINFCGSLSILLMV